MPAYRIADICLRRSEGSSIGFCTVNGPPFDQVGYLLDGDVLLGPAARKGQFGFELALLSSVSFRGVRWDRCNPSG